MQEEEYEKMQHIPHIKEKHNLQNNAYSIKIYNQRFEFFAFKRREREKKKTKRQITNKCIKNINNKTKQKTKKKIKKYKEITKEKKNT